MVCCMPASAPPPHSQADHSLASIASPLVDPFALVTPERDRTTVIGDAGAPPVPASVLAGERTRLTFEGMWRSLIAQLMLVAVSESTFLQRFFGTDASVADLFLHTMKSTESVLLSALESFAANTGDAPGLILLVALTEAQRRVMADRRCSALDRFFSHVTTVVWPRLKVTIDANVAAVKAARDNVRRLAPVEPRVHYITPRYAEFVTSILNLHRKLAAGHLSDDGIPMHMAALGNDMEVLWQRMAQTLLPAGLPQYAFMIHNFSLCLAVAQARGLHADDAGAWDRATDRYLSLYVDAALTAHFRSSFEYVRRVEGGLGLTTATPPLTVLTAPESALAALRVTPAEAEAVLRDFNSSWRSGVKGLNDDATRLFGAATSGGAPGSGSGGITINLLPVVLRRVMTGFLALYDRLVAILARGLPAGSNALREVLEKRTLMLELDKYSREMAAAVAAAAAAAAATATSAGAGAGFGAAGGVPGFG